MVSNRLHNQVRDWHTAEVGCTAEDWGAAARKLIGNHEYVLRDAVHPEPRTQIDLARSSASDAAAVDAALLAVAECLLEGASLFGNADSGSWPNTTLPAPATPEAAAVWVAISKYLERRMQNQFFCLFQTNILLHDALSLCCVTSSWNYEFVTGLTSIKTCGFSNLIILSNQRLTIPMLQYEISLWLG